MLTSTSVCLDFGHVYGDLNGDKVMKEEYGVKQSRSVQNADCRLQTADRAQNADCRLQTGYKMQTDI